MFAGRDLTFTLILLGSVLVVSGNNGRSIASYGNVALTGEALFKKLLQALATDENEAATIAAANVGVSRTNSSGVYLSNILRIADDNAALHKILATNGSGLTEAACLAQMTEIGVNTAGAQAQEHAVLPPPPLTGEPFYQSVLGTLGRDLDAIFAAVTNVTLPSPPGPYLTVILNLVNDSIVVQTLIGNGDKDQNCVVSAIALAATQVSILNTLNDSK